MPVAAAILGGAVIGGIVSSKSASKAADAQKDAANTASQTQLALFDKQAALQEPWRQAGMGSLSQLTAGTAAGGDFNTDFATPAPVSRDFTMADFNADPGYAFRMQEGQRALESSAAARGGLLSGGTGKALADYGQQAGSQEYGAAYDRFNNFENRKRQDYGDAYNRFNADRDRRFNRLAGIAGIGQTATRDVSNAAGNAGNNIADNQMAVGNANSANYIAQGNAANQAIGTIGNWYAQQPQQQSGAAWWANGQSGGNSAAGSWGTPGLNQFWYGNGTSGD